ncbi:recombination regulator RecX [Pasteurellaceae bacterium 22721_9_1]
MSSLALGYVLSLLARREYSEFEIRCKMQEKAFSEQEIEDTINHCQQKNWQNDLRFAENYLNYRAQRGFGVNRIKQELKQLKGIRSEVIQQAIEQSEIDWSQIAKQVLQKKRLQFPLDQKAKQKIWRYMISHGFYAEDFADLIDNVEWEY